MRELASAAGSVPVRVAVGFAVQRPQLERDFLSFAAASGKPRGLRWEKIDFSAEPLFACHCETGEWAAFVEATISFSAIPDGGMEHVAAVGNLRQATAVFHFRAGNWGTAGRALFNMTPKEAVDRFATQFRPIE